MGTLPGLGCDTCDDVHCGVPFCSQFLGTCPGGGLFVSNSLDWEIGST